MRRRRTSLLLTAALVATTAAAAAVTDATVAHAAGQRIARAAACRLKPSGRVDAGLDSALGGLTALTGSLGGVHIDATGVQRDHSDFDLHVALDNVTTSGSYSSGTATATVPFGSLQQRLGSGHSGMTVGSDGSGLTLTGTAGQFGLPVVVHTALTTSADSLTVTPTTVTVMGRDVPVSTLESFSGTSSLTGRLAPHTVDLSLPPGAGLRSARAGSAGLVLVVALPSHTGTHGGASSGSGSSCTAG